MIDKHQRNLALLVASCLFMENLDGTIVTTAAPRIGADLHVSRRPWTGDHGLPHHAAVLIPLSGWMVSALGSRKCSSLPSSSSPRLGAVRGERQLLRTGCDAGPPGAGGAMMVPVGAWPSWPERQADMMRMIAYIVWPP